MNKAPVTAAAALKRINRALAKDRRQLVKNRPGPRSRARSTGWSACEWLEIDHASGGVADGVDDLERYARELGVLREWECLEEARALAPPPTAKPTSIKGRSKAPVATGRGRPKPK